MVLESYTQLMIFNKLYLKSLIESYLTLDMSNHIYFTQYSSAYLRQTFDHTLTNPPIDAIAPKSIYFTQFLRMHKLGDGHAEFAPCFPLCGVFLF